MPTDRRGFEYALEAVRTLTEWDVNDLVRQLAAHSTEVEAQQGIVDGLAQNFAGARATIVAQWEQNRVDIDAQRQTHAYLLQIQRSLTQETAKLRELEAAREATLQRLAETRRYAEGLERDKEAAALEHDRKQANIAYQEADDTWLQRIRWKETP